MKDFNLEDSLIQRPGSSSSLEQIVRIVRPAIQDGLDAGVDKRTLGEAISLLVSYAVAIEKILAEAAGRDGTLPGHSVSVRSYFEQALSGDARSGSNLRLHKYLKDAIKFFMQTHAAHQKSLDRFAESLADALRPSHIEKRVPVNAFLRLLGLHEGAYWKEYNRQCRSLDASGVRQLAEDRNRPS